MVSVELLTCESLNGTGSHCPSISLGTVPQDVLELVVIGIYPINDQLAESLDQFLTRVASFLDDTVIAYSPFTCVRLSGATLWMTDKEEK